MNMTPTAKPRTGRRKEAVARVRLAAGTGKVTVNDRTPLEYLSRATLVQHAMHALTVTNTTAKYDITARVHGGGLSGQAGALRMAIARALVADDETLRGLLGREGLLTREARGPAETTGKASRNGGGGGSTPKEATRWPRSP
jgi:small subunit ribosomal protein S9